MPIPIVCPACEAKLQAHDHTVGKRIGCPKCKTAFTVPPPSPIFVPPPVRQTVAQNPPPPVLDEKSQWYQDDKAPASRQDYKLVFIVVGLFLGICVAAPLLVSNFRSAGRSSTTYSYTDPADFLDHAANYKGKLVTIAAVVEYTFIPGPLGSEGPVQLHLCHDKEPYFTFDVWAEKISDIPNLSPGHRVLVTFKEGGHLSDRYGSRYELVKISRVTSDEDWWKLK